MQPEHRDDPESLKPNTGQPSEQRDPGMEAYEIVSDVVDGVPSLRWKDNLIQGLSILGTVLVGAVIGWAVAGEWWGALTGAFAGLVGGLILSGAVLMVLGWVRTARKINISEKNK
jgi:hypothetical protein